MISGDTIVAISSASGQAARIILRLSGPAALQIADRVCSQTVDRQPSARRAVLLSRDLPVPAWLYVFRAPRSYTGEDLLELHVPGNPLLAKILLGELMRCGARQADAGEFTARAYFNRRMDLTEAEGVAATIAARSQQELLAARQLLAGELSRRLRPIMEDLANLLALVEAGIDFSEEDITFLGRQELGGRISQIRSSLTELAESSSRFDRLAHQPQLVLVGRPNAGKSTLLNALTGSQRAVVSPVEGTTRDVIWAELPLPRGIVRLIDAAGLLEQLPPPSDHSPHASIARQMHQRAQAAVENADVVLLVHDLTDGRPRLIPPRSPDLAILSKADLLPQPPPPQAHQIPVSAKTQSNMSLLRQHLDEMAFGRFSEGSSLALNARHLSAIEEARLALSRIKGDNPLSDELLALELRQALDALGRIIGQVTPDEVLARVFATFCIGK